MKAQLPFRTKWTKQILMLLSILLVAHASGQDTYSDTLNCNGGTPTFIVDLSEDADSLWVSDPASRGGSCCTPPDDNCVQFSLTLADDASGIIFYIPDGCGAAPTGSLFYQVDCGPLTTVGEPLCLEGSGPFTITFCKPGSNENCYSIKSIPQPQASEDIMITDACLDSLWISGLDEPTITWMSVFPGGPGEYDFLLDCTTGCDTVIVEGEVGETYPELIKYQVCGLSPGGCFGTPYCDTLEVAIVPALAVTIEPEEPTICYGEAGIEITALPTGGADPYSYNWNTGDTTAALFASEPGTYFVGIMDGTGCAIAYDTVVVTEYLVPIMADAGADITVCALPDPTVDLSGIVTGSTTAVWSGFTGVFDTDSTDLTPTYTPSASELLAGFAELILTTTDNGSCPGDEDTILIFFTTFETALDMVVDDVDCFGNATGGIDLTPTGGALPLTFDWDTGDITEDLAGLPAGDYAVVLTDANGCMDSALITITEPEPLTESAVVENISCFGFLDGEIDLTILGGTLGYEFEWDTGEITEDLVGLPSGTYGFTVTDANGCELSGSYVLTSPTALVLTETHNNVSCNGLSDGAVDVSITGGIPDYGFLWNTGAVTEDLTGMAAGLYLLTITDSNACEITLELEITEPEPLLATAEVVNLSCFEADNGAIDVTVAGGTPTYSFIWSTGSLAEDISDIAAGDYTFTVTDDNGCTFSETYTVSEPSELLVTLVGVDIACFGDSTGAVTSITTGGTPSYTYNWTTGDDTEALVGLPSGYYAVTVVDGNGCEVFEAISLLESSLIETEIDGTDESCIGSMDGTADLEVTGGTAPYTFEWEVGDLTIEDEDLTGLGEGIYYVEITDSNGCPALDSIRINSPEDYDAGPDTSLTFCSGDGLLNLNPYLFATASGEWTEVTASGHFNPLTGVFDLNDLAAGDYLFHYIIPAYTPCTDTLAEFTITVNPKPLVSFTADAVIGCAPLSISFSNLYDFVGSSCTWDMGDGTIIEGCGPINHVYEYPGDYDVTLEVVSDLGCSNSFTAENFIHIYDRPMAAFTYAPDFPSIQDPEVEFINNSIDAVSYEWNFGDGTAESGLESPFHLFPDTGNQTYLVRLIATNEFECKDTAFQKILIEDVLIYYVPNIFTPDGDDYNNVFKPIMTAGYDIYAYRLMIFNRWGEILFESQNADFGWDGSYGGNELVDDGVYIWTLEFTETLSTKTHSVQGHVTLLK